MLISEAWAVPARRCPESFVERLALLRLGVRDRVRLAARGGQRDRAHDRSWRHRFRIPSYTMLPLGSQELVRDLILRTDHLSRLLYEAHDTTRATRLAALRSTLQRLDRAMGGASPPFALAGEFDVVYQRIRDVVLGIDSDRMRPACARLLEHAEWLRPARPAASHAPPRPFSLWIAGALGLGALAPLALAAFSRAGRFRAGWGISAAMGVSSLGVLFARLRAPPTPRWSSHVPLTLAPHAG